MFSPKGYLPVSQLFSNALGIVDELVQVYFDAKTSVHTVYIRSPDDHVMHMLSDFCLDDLYLSDGQCDPVKVDGSLLFMEKLYWGLYVHDHSAEEVIALRISQSLHNRFNLATSFPDAEIKSFEAFMDNYIRENGSERGIENNEYYGEVWSKIFELQGFASPSLFINPSVFSVSLELFDHFMGLKEDLILKIISSDAIAMAEHLRRFEGYFLCVPAMKVENEWDRFWTGRAFREVESSSPRGLGADRPATGGRRRLYELSREYWQYTMKFQRGEMSWSQTQAHIKHKTGENPDVKTLRDWVASQLPPRD